MTTATAQAIRERAKKIEWLTCDGCGLLWPADANQSPGVERVTTCQRCLYAANGKLLAALAEREAPQLKERTVDDDIPRRIRIDRMVPAELAIREAMLAVEKLPADTRLTEAVIRLGDAAKFVADYVDGVPLAEREAPLPPECVLCQADDVKHTTAEICGWHYQRLVKALAEEEAACDLAEAKLAEREVQAPQPPNLSPDDTMDVYVPGAWKCPTCGFQLSQATLFMGSGEIGCSRDQVMRMSGELCPNDQSSMARVTWRERAEDNQQWGESLMEQIIAATGAPHLPAALEAIKLAMAALQSIANSSCCGGCQEAALVARKTLVDLAHGAAQAPQPPKGEA